VHVVVAVDDQMNNCRTGSPWKVACQRWSWTGIGDDDGAFFQAVIN